MGALSGAEEQPERASGPSDTGCAYFCTTATFSHSRASTQLISRRLWPSHFFRSHSMATTRTRRALLNWQHSRARHMSDDEFLDKLRSALPLLPGRGLALWMPQGSTPPNLDVV